MEHRIVVKGEVDLATAPDLLRRLDETIEANQGTLVIVDLSRVSFVDSSGLGVLVAAHRRAKSLGGELVVEGISEGVRQVFDVTGLDKVLLAHA